MRRGLALVAATALASTGCGGGDSNSAKATTTIVAGAPLRIPDDGTIEQAFGPDAKIARSEKPIRGGVIDRACGGGNASLRTRTLLAIKGRSPGGAQVEINLVLLEFSSAGVASSYFTSYARGTLDCEWTDTNGEKRRLDDVASAEDVGGARQLQVRVLHDTATGAITTNTILLRGATVVDLGATSSTAAATAVDRMATLLTG